MFEAMIWFTLGQWSIFLAYFAGRMWVDIRALRKQRRDEKRIEDLINSGLFQMREEIGEPQPKTP